MTIELTTYCVICTNPIPEERAAKRAITCEKTECKKQLKAIRRARTDMRRCRVCAKPSTPEERKAFHRWRKNDPEMQATKKAKQKKHNKQGE